MPRFVLRNVACCGVFGGLLSGNRADKTNGPDEAISLIGKIRLISQIRLIGLIGCRQPNYEL